MIYGPISTFGPIHYISIHYISSYQTRDLTTSALTRKKLNKTKLKILIFNCDFTKRLFLDCSFPFSHVDDDVIKKRKREKFSRHLMNKNVDIM